MCEFDTEDSNIQVRLSLNIKNYNMSGWELLSNLPIPQLSDEVNYKEPTQLAKDVENVACKLVQQIATQESESFDSGSDCKETSEDFNKKDIKVVQIKGGITNLLYLVSWKNHYQKYLIRVYGENTEFLIDRPKETLLLYELGSFIHSFFILFVCMCCVCVCMFVSSYFVTMQTKNENKKNMEKHKTKQMKNKKKEN